MPSFRFFLEHAEIQAALTFVIDQHILYMNMSRVRPSILSCPADEVGRGQSR